MQRAARPVHALSGTPWKAGMASAGQRQQRLRWRAMLTRSQPPRGGGAPEELSGRGWLAAAWLRVPFGYASYVDPAPRQAGTSSGARASAARHTAAPFASARRLCRRCAPRTHARSEARPACQCAAPGGSAPRHTSQACPLRRGGRYEQVASTTGHQGATSGESCTQPPADDSSCPPGAVTV